MHEEVRKVGQTSFVPTVGMVFDSEDKVYEMYNMYARTVDLVLERAIHYTLEIYGL